MAVRCHRQVLSVCMLVFCLAINVDAAAQVAVARAIPATDMTLSVHPLVVLSGITRPSCLRECVQMNCQGFNYGQQQCELLGEFLCNSTQTLTPRPGYMYYDVETGEWMLAVDDYRQATDCLALNRCSPKCYTTSPTTTTGPQITTTTASATQVTTTAPQTTTTVPQTTTTTVPQTTTTTTQATTTVAMTTTTASSINLTCSSDTDCAVFSHMDCRNGGVCTCVAGYSFEPDTSTCVTNTTSPTTTTGPQITTATASDTQVTTTAPQTTTTAPQTTTTAPQTTTTAPQTTTTVPQTTTTTTQATTTVVMTTTTAPSINLTCSSDTDCAVFSHMDCRNDGVCNCVAGYSFEPGTSTCVTSCPTGLGGTFTKTADYRLVGYIIVSYNSAKVTRELCFQECASDPACLSLNYDHWNEWCHLSNATSFGHNDTNVWENNPFYEYYQRDCA